ncbi:MAG: hypothetical protein ABI472_05710 [Ginsengibacter sp.]
MDLYSKKSSSIPQKITIIFFEIISIGISYWMLFLSGYHFLFSHSNLLSVLGMFP